jgi:hypothetical protein
VDAALAPAQLNTYVKGDPRRQDGDSWVWQVEEVRVTRHEGVSLFRLRERDQIIVAAISAHGQDVGRVVAGPGQLSKVLDIASGFVERDPTAELRALDHASQFAQQPRAGNKLGHLSFPDRR